jgi:hypothetical protein
LREAVDGEEGRQMLLLAVLFLTWVLVASAAVILCLAARRGDEEMAEVRPVVLRAIDGSASRSSSALS